MSTTKPSVAYCSTVLCIAVLLGLGGCVPQQVINTYLLDARAAERPALAAGARNSVLLVAEPRADAGFDTPRIAYTRTPFALEYYTQSTWVDNPARMLIPLLVDALERSRGFDVVLPMPTSVDGDLRLETTLIRLQQEFQPQPPSQVRLTLRAKLIDIPSNHVLGTQLFEVVETAPSEDAYGAVQAANKAVQQVLEKIQDFAVRYAPEKNKFGQALPGAGTAVSGVPAVPPRTATGRSAAMSAAAPSKQRRH
jgi:cholesterol transport system auxiliary component